MSVHLTENLKGINLINVNTNVSVWTDPRWDNVSRPGQVIPLKFVILKKGNRKRIWPLHWLLYTIFVTTVDLKLCLYRHLTLKSYDFDPPSIRYEEIRICYSSSWSFPWMLRATGPTEDFLKIKTLMISTSLSSDDEQRV